MTQFGCLSGNHLNRNVQFILPWTDGKVDKDNEVIPATTVIGELLRIEQFKTKDGYIRYMDGDKVKKWPAIYATSVHVKTTNTKPSGIVEHSLLSFTLPNSNYLRFID